MARPDKILKNAKGEVLRKIISVISPSTGEEYYLYLPRDFVPLVARNHDWLVGFVTGAYSALQPGSTLKFNMHSLRFIDLTDDGKRLSGLSPEYAKKMLDDKQEEYKNMRPHPDNDCKPITSFLTLNCPCGNSYAFKTEKDIPQHPMCCDLCSKLLLDFHHINDYFIISNDNPAITIDSSEKEAKQYILSKTEKKG